MNRIMLAAFVTAAFAPAVGHANAATRELLFGPDEPAIVHHKYHKHHTAKPVPAPTRAAAASPRAAPVSAPAPLAPYAISRSAAAPAALPRPAVRAPTVPAALLLPAVPTLPRLPPLPALETLPAPAAPPPRARHAPAATIAPSPAAARPAVAATTDDGPVTPLSANPFEERRRLAATFRQGLTLGILPGLSAGSPHNYVNDLAYLPFINYLSKQTGRLLIPAYEPDPERFRAALLAHRYPLVHINSALAPDARRAGYILLATSGADVSAALIVRAGSPINQLPQLRGHTLFVDTTDPVTAAAFTGLAYNQLGEHIRSIDLRGETQVASRILDGAADAGVVSSTHAAALMRRRPGAFRILHSFPAGPTDGVWALPGALPPAATLRLLSALNTLSSTPRLAGIAQAMTRLTHLPVTFQPAIPSAR